MRDQMEKALRSTDSAVICRKHDPAFLYCCDAVRLWYMTYRYLHRDDAYVFVLTDSGKEFLRSNELAGCEVVTFLF